MLTPAPIQTTFPQYMTVAQVGQPGTMTTFNVVTRLCEDPSGNGIGFGLAVSQGTLRGDKSAALGQLSGGSFIGITQSDSTIYNDGVHVDKYLNGDNMGVRDLGDIWVSPATTNVVAGHAVYFNSSTGQLGDSSISNAVLIANAKWLDSKPNTDEPSVAFNGLARVLLGAMS